MAFGKTIIAQMDVQCLGSSGCIVDSGITIVSGNVSPPAVPGDPYIVNGDGQVVELCYEITNYNQINGNRHHGTEVDLGPGWQALDPSSSTSDPGSGASGTGNWIWYEYINNCVTGFSCNVPSAPMFGWWYDSADNLSCAGTANDGDASNNTGDDNPTNIPLQYCLTLTTDCGGMPAAISTAVGFRNHSDSETGTNSNCGCESGALECSIPIEVICCEPPAINSILADGSCADDVTTLVATGFINDPDYSYQWTGPNGVMGPQGLLEPTWNIGPGNVDVGIYNLLVTDVNNPGCPLSYDVEIFSGGLGGSDFTVPEVCTNLSFQYSIFPDAGAATSGTFGGPFCMLPGVDCDTIDMISGLPFVFVDSDGFSGLGLEGTTSSLSYTVGDALSPCFSVDFRSLNLDSCFFDCTGALNGTDLPGQPCNDNDPTTANETWQMDCSCVGDSFDCEGVFGGSAVPGTACDDNNPNTTNEVYNVNCMCVDPAACSPLLDNDSDGYCSDVDCDDNDVNIGVAGDSCNDGNPLTSNDVLQSDCSCAGAVSLDCPNLSDANGNIGFNFGDACDDGNAATANDTVQNNCSCQGQATACPQSIVAPLDMAVCAGDAVDLSVSFLNSGVVTWSLPGSPTTTSGEVVSFVANPVGSCNETQVISYVVSCPGDPTFLNLGTVSIDIFVQPDASILSTECSITLTPTCSDFVISGGNQSSNPNVFVANPGDGGTQIFQIDNPGAPASCSSNQIFMSYNCPSVMIQGNLSVDVFLEGYVLPDGTMRTILQEDNLLPLTQPYSAAPHFYQGSESVGAHANDIVDWVLVELRDSSDPTIIVEQQAARLRSDGAVVDANGSTNLAWTSGGIFYIVVKHRSHLGVQSISPVNISSPGAFFDFSADLGQAAGLEQLVLESGVVCVSSGDYDQNGIVNFSDFILWLSNNNVLGVYIEPDADGNGVINFFDFILWLRNRNKFGPPSIFPI